MTIEEIRKNKPDGATHYRARIFGVTYFRKTNRGIEMYNWNEWIKTGHSDLESFKPL